ncbi:MAG TPA: hydrogenase maturation protease [Thermoplasmata archaeon]
MTESDEKKGKILVLGVGNPILSDDGVGIHVARILKEKLIPGIEIDELPASGLELLDIVHGYERVIIVDSIKTDGGKPGELYELQEEDFQKTIHGSSPHGINIPTALAMGRKIIPEQMPKEILFFAIEAKDTLNVSEKLTPEVAAALPGIVEQILRKLT